jgi:uncharacterized protein YueI
MLRRVIINKNLDKSKMASEKNQLNVQANNKNVVKEHLYKNFKMTDDYQSYTKKTKELQINFLRRSLGY